MTIAPEIEVVRTLDGLMQVTALRALCYVGEQSCPYHEEFDGNDFAGATHLLAKCNGEPVGTLRVRWFADFAKVERVAVRREHRGRRVVEALWARARALAEMKGYRTVLGHIEAHLLPLWKRLAHAKARPGRAPLVFSDREYVEIEIDLTPPRDALNIDAAPLRLLRPEGEWNSPGILDDSAKRLTAKAAA